MSMYYNINEREIAKFQGIINYTVRVQKKRRKSDDVALTITTLGWPKMKRRIKHSIVCLIYKILNTGKPLSLSELFKIVSCSPYKIS
jgi:hypothetical protein